MLMFREGGILCRRPGHGEVPGRSGGRRGLSLAAIDQACVQNPTPQRPAPSACPGPCRSLLRPPATSQSPGTPLPTLPWKRAMPATHQPRDATLLARALPGSNVTHTHTIRVLVQDAHSAVSRTLANLSTELKQVVGGGCRSGGRWWVGGGERGAWEGGRGASAGTGGGGGGSAHVCFARQG